MFNGLDESYRPLSPPLSTLGREGDDDDADPSDEPMRPFHPTRIRSFIYACGLIAEGEPVRSIAVNRG